MFSIRIWQKKSSEKLSLEQYAIVASFLNYENTVLVQRNSLYLLANATLLAPAWEPIHKLLTCTYSPQLSDPLVCASEQSTVSVIVFGLSVVGLLLSLLWLHATRASVFWIHHWHKHLIELESKAFDGNHLLREFKHDGYPSSGIGAKKVLKLTIYLFIIVWFILFISVLYVKIGFLSPIHFMWVVLCGIAGVASIALFFQEIYWRYKQELKMEGFPRRQRQS